MVLPASRRVPRVPRYLGVAQGAWSLSPTGLSPCIAGLSRARSARDLVSNSTAPLQWRHARSCNTADTTLAGLHIDGLGCSPFARRYWGNRVCFLFLRVLRWFTSPGWLRHPMYSDAALEDCPRGVAPFGDLRVKACLRLTEAYRSLPRPSSPSCAKASTVRP